MKKKMNGAVESIITLVILAVVGLSLMAGILLIQRANEIKETLTTKFGTVQIVNNADKYDLYPQFELTITNDAAYDMTVSYQVKFIAAGETHEVVTTETVTVKAGEVKKITVKSNKVYLASSQENLETDRETVKTIRWRAMATVNTLKVDWL